MDDKFKALEQDARFPSGKWTGFFVQKNPPLGKQWMDLQCMFEKGIITASGNDIVGAFTLKGITILQLENAVGTKYTKAITLFIMKAITRARGYGAPG